MTCAVIHCSTHAMVASSSGVSPKGIRAPKGGLAVNFVYMTLIAGSEGSMSSPGPPMAVTPMRRDATFGDWRSSPIVLSAVA